jgi:hypothetical protein
MTLIIQFPNNLKFDDTATLDTVLNNQSSTSSFCKGIYRSRTMRLPALESSAKLVNLTILGVLEVQNIFQQVALKVPH